MKIHPIKLAYDKLNLSIKNTAKDYVEGTNILIRCLATNAKRNECEVLDWLNHNDIKLKGLKTYKPCDD